MAPCRSGLMTIGMAIEASTIESTIESTEKISRDSVVHLVDRLRHILESTKRHFNPKYREKCKIYYPFSLSYFKFSRFLVVL